MGWKFLLPVALLSALLIACDKAPVLAKGAAAPAFVLEDLQGAQRQFPTEFNQHPVVIRFWADWCASCRSEMVLLDAQYRQRRDKGLQVLAVNVGQDRDTAQRFVSALGVTYGTLLDGHSAVARQYGVIALPTTYLVDRQGKIHTKILGETDAATLSRLLDALMETPS